MKKFFKHIVLCFLFLCITLSCCVILSPAKNNNISLADNSSTQAENQNIQSENRTIFIRKPTYSVFYNNKIFFIDDADKLLKVICNVNNTNQALNNDKYISLSEFYTDKPFDVCYLNGKLYILTHEENKNRVIKINLDDDNFGIDENFELETTRDYDDFHVQKSSFSENDYTIFTFYSTGENPYVAVVNETTTEEIKYKELSLNSSLNNYLKVLSYQESANSQLYIIFVFDTKISYFSFNSIDDLTNFSGTIGGSTNDISIPSTVQQKIADFNIVNISSTDYFFISYENLDYVKLYTFKLGTGIDTNMTFKTDIPCKNSGYTLFNGGIFVTTNEEEQKLFYNIITDTGTDLLHSKQRDIENPDYTITYFEDNIDADADKFVYKTTTTATYLYQKPWGANPLVILAEGVDVIQIGSAHLKNETKTPISDYDYCLFTFGNKNYSGFIKSSELSKKDAVTQNSYSKRVTVWPETRLYTLPTVVEGIIGETSQGNFYSLSRNSALAISENDEIEVIDLICGYSCMGEKMVKICVNGTKYGFVEAKCIHNPSDVKEFVITNATIKQDGTIVYKDKNTSSETFSFKLNSGKNVRINGKRDTKTGWTSITFNDEYGNEFSGYIQTDYIKADAWSTLQILGCILIAINIGLLILILVYKKKHLGSHGQKIETDEEIVK